MDTSSSFSSSAHMSSIKVGNLAALSLFALLRFSIITLTFFYMNRTKGHSAISFCACHMLFPNGKWKMTTKGEEKSRKQM